MKKALSVFCVLFSLFIAITIFIHYEKSKVTVERSTVINQIDSGYQVSSEYYVDNNSCFDITVKCKTSYNSFQFLTKGEKEYVVIPKHSDSEDIDIMGFKTICKTKNRSSSFLVKDVG
ncbi:MAG: hypothetical protein IJS03_01245 [Eubacterium sp.]|nr:hypothetical protein [Eubacterium sp.]